MRLSFRLLNVIILIIFLPGIEVWAADFPDKTNPIIISPKSDLEQQIIKNIRKQTIEQAERLLSEKPDTVTASSCKWSTGGTNDFYSEGDYWWPDPAKPDDPYIQKDGQTNPENFSDHRHAMIRLSEITATITSAWLLTGDKKFAYIALNI